MKFLFVLVAFVAMAINAASVKNLGEFSYESCSAAPEAIVINSFDLKPDPIPLPGTVAFSISVTSSVAVTSPTPADFTLSYRADANSEWTDFHCVDKPFICGHPDVCLVLDEIFPLDQPCPQSFVDNGVPCHCPFEATTYKIVDGTLNLTTTLEEHGLIPGDYRLKIALSKDDVEIQCYSFQTTLVDA